MSLSNTMFSCCNRRRSLISRSVLRASVALSKALDIWSFGTRTVSQEELENMGDAGWPPRGCWPADLTHLLNRHFLAGLRVLRGAHHTVGTLADRFDRNVLHVNLEEAAPYHVALLSGPAACDTTENSTEVLGRKCARGFFGARMPEGAAPWLDGV